MRRRCALVVAERDRVTEALRKLAAGRAGQPGQLRLAAAGRPGRRRSAEACEARGVIVRPFAGDGVRVTIGTPAENDAFLAAAEAALA